MGRDKQVLALAVVVLFHLAVSMAHGSVHTSAGVDLSAPALVFVVAVIIAGPLIGLAWMWANPLAGARLIGITMAASLLFGLINHFVIPGADRVDHVAAHSRTLFAATAVMIAVLEAAGAALGFAYRRRIVRGVL